MYAYQKMPYILINAWATFQRAMDVAFIGFINKILVLYLDDITIYSKNINNHFMISSKYLKGVKYMKSP